MRGYSLTSGDLIRATTGQWDSFAAENAGQGALSSAIIGRNLFDMVTGAATCRCLSILHAGQPRRCRDHCCIVATSCWC